MYFWIKLIQFNYGKFSQERLFVLIIGIVFKDWSGLTENKKISQITQFRDTGNLIKNIDSHIKRLAR